MTTASQTETPSTRAWWRTAPNPPCSPWCELRHEDDEFTVGAAMSCRLTIMKTDEFEVRVEQYHGGEEEQPGAIYVDPKNVYVYAPALHDEFLTPDDAERIVRELTAAVAAAVEEARA